MIKEIYKELKKISTKETPFTDLELTFYIQNIEKAFIIKIKGIGLRKDGTKMRITKKTSIKESYFYEPAFNDLIKGKFDLLIDAFKLILERNLNK